MIKSGIDHDALIAQFSQATAKQGEALRNAVRDATLRALQGRELTLKNIKSVLASVTQATSAGAMKNPLGAAAAEPLLEKAAAGMDAALRQAVEAQRRVLQQFLDQGANLQEQQFEKALADLGKMEQTLLSSIEKATDGAAGALQGPWGKLLGALQAKGSDTGKHAQASVQQFADAMRSSLGQGRTAGLKGAKAMLEAYGTLASGVLIGMSQALDQTQPPAAARRGKRAS